MKKKLRLKQSVKDILAGILLISVIVLGGLAMCLRSEQLDNKKGATESEFHIAQLNSNQ